MHDTLVISKLFALLIHFGVYAGAGAYAGCVYCTHIGQYSTVLQKMVYPGNRKFLPVSDPERTDTKNYPCQCVETMAPPNLKSMEYVDQANSQYDRATSTAEKKRLAQATGCKGTYSLRRASSHDRILNTPVDPMHLVKNIVEHIVNLVVGKEDSSKVRKQEVCCRFPSAWMKQQISLPKAPFSLTKDDILVTDNRAKSIGVPSGFDWHPSAVFGKRSGMKSHEWKQVVYEACLVVNSVIPSFNCLILLLSCVQKTLMSKTSMISRRKCIRYWCLLNAIFLCQCSLSFSISYTISQCLYVVLDQSTDFGCSLTKGLIRGFHEG